MKKHLLLLVLFLSAVALVHAQDPWPETGAADNFGYTWKTSAADGGPVYEWVDITTDGIEVTGLTDDNFLGPFDMGIDFQYYWTQFSSVYIGSNGYIAFQPGNIASTSIGFPPTPSAAPAFAPDAVIAPLMADLSPVGVANPGKVYFYSDRETQRFIVSYIEMPFWTVEAPSYQGSNTFQVILDASDSTITFQYQDQQGSWNSSYDNSPNPMVAGIENSTGSIGLMVSNQSRPTPGTAVRFFAPKEALLSVPDAGVVAVQNSSSTGSFLPKGLTTTSSTFLSAEVGSVGNASLDFDTQVLGTVMDTSGNLFFQRQINVDAGVAAGTSVPITFDIPFNPPLPGPYVYTVQAGNPADINPTNNTGEAEIVVVDTTGGQATFTFCSENSNNLDGLVNWSDESGGDSGGGVFFESYGYPIILESVEFLLAFDPDAQITQGFKAQVYKNVPGQPAPGELVFEKEMTVQEIVDNQDPDDNWVKVEIGSGGVVITEQDGGFYVSWIEIDPGISLFTETASPISRNTYEIQGNSWAQYRLANSEDFFIRANANVSFAQVSTSAKDDLSDLSRFEISPNPSQGVFEIDFAFEQPKNWTLSIYDVQGKKVFLENGNRQGEFRETLDLSQLSKGLYVVHLQTAQGRKTKKLLLR